MTRRQAHWSMTLHLSLTVHDPTTLSLSERLEVAQLDADASLFAFPDDPPPVVSSMAEELGMEAIDEAVRLVLARREGRLLGRAKLDYSLTQNTGQVFVHVSVHPEERRRGVGIALAHRAGLLSLELGRSVYMTATNTRAPQGKSFVARLGGSPALEMITSDLRMDGLDRGLLSRWMQRPDPDAYALHRFSSIPAQEFGRVAAIMEVMNTAPRGELNFEDWKITAQMVERWQEMIVAYGETRLLYAAEHLESRELVGYTEIFWHPERASVAYQGATGVRPEHRGQGLGKWLKAAVLLDVPGEFPGTERVRTGNADSNAAMLGINRALGFAPAFGRTEWQGKVQELIQASRKSGAEAPEVAL
jgi:mycothiol synthase